ncbi:hypothetical protein [Legionella fairfieldensis]|uniref:hypothetical protein n=1 Tax=Legionella fairfieldensis TaxID=45064 RepID=UPI00048DA2CF|nr:hypothetical protein [Legionella fairfieldensis]
MTYFNLAVYCENETIKIKAETIYKISSEEAAEPVQTPQVITSLEDLPSSPSLPFSNAWDRFFFDFSSLATDLHTLIQNSINFSGYELPASYGGDIEQFKMDTVIFELPTNPLLAINFILLLHYSQYNDGVRYNRSFEKCLVDSQVDYYLPIFGRRRFDDVRAFFDGVGRFPSPSDCSLSKKQTFTDAFLEGHLLINNFRETLENPPNRYQDVLTHLNTFFQGSLSKYINYRSLNNAYESDQVLLEQYNEMLPDLKRLNTLNQSNPLKNNGFFSFSEKGSVNPERSSRICQCTIV